MALNFDSKPAHPPPGIYRVFFEKMLQMPHGGTSSRVQNTWNFQKTANSRLMGYGKKSHFDDCRWKPVSFKILIE